MLNIDKIMTNWEIDGAQINRQWAWYAGNLKGFFTELSEILNTHIASLKQETPITPELLERAGFNYFKDNAAIETWRKGDLCVLYMNGDFYLWVAGRRFTFTRTMESLSIVHNGVHGQPLNWQDDPAAELRKRLEAMGFWKKANEENVYCGSVAGITFYIKVNNFTVYDYYPGYPLRKIDIKTIDALERVVKELKGE